jgi:hypothetical protein
MRFLLVAFTGLMLLVTGSAAQANISITVDKNAQLMTIAVDGVQRYQWPVSTGVPARETPNGTFHAFRMEANHFSREFDDAPMPHSIFFTKIVTPSMVPNPKAVSARRLPTAACGCRAPTPRRCTRWSRRKACSTPR